MLDLALPRITPIETEDKYASYDIEPLEAGYGRTLGNALRRVLLSSLPGSAITSIKIEGAQHEFQDVPGIREDVTDIILNLKKIVFVLHGEADEHEISLVKDGPGAVTAGDIQLEHDVEVVDPKQLIATLTKEVTLNMELKVNRGRGYQPVAARAFRLSRVICSSSAGRRMRPPSS